MEQDKYFNSEQSKVIRGWLEDDAKTYKISHDKTVKRKEWWYKFGGVVYLYILVSFCLIYALIDKI